MKKNKLVRTKRSRLRRTSSESILHNSRTIRENDRIATEPIRLKFLIPNCLKYYEEKCIHTTPKKR